MKDVFKGDFDFYIPEIILIHKFSYTAHLKSEMYVKGRHISGLVYCINGSALYKFDNTEFILYPGEILFFPENAAYSVTCIGESFDHITVNFKTTFNYEDTKYIKNFNTFAKKMKIKDTFDALTMLNKMLYIWENKNNGYKVLSKSILYEILYKYIILVEKKHQNIEYEKIKAAKTFLDNNYTKNITTDEIAKMCNFSSTHFRRIFHKTFDCSPTEYRTFKRIEHAKDLLLTGEMSVNEIARIIGFEDANYFSRIFKKQTGFTPCEYAKIY